MPSLNFVTLDVFTQTRFAGNPLGLVRIPQGQNVSTEQMQIMAREFNLSETLFIHEPPSDSNGIPEWRVRIFLTNSEVPFAGHPTIGAACYALGTMAKGATKGRFICNAGPIELDFAGGVAKAEIPHNFHHHTEVPFTLEQVYELQPELKKAGIVPKAIDVTSPVKGMNFVCVELSDLDALALAYHIGVPVRPTLDKDWNWGFPGSLYYVITEKGEGSVKIRSRMIEGKMEDPATGSGTCGLTAFLALKWRESRMMRFEVSQAVEMGRRSDMGVEITLKEDLKAVEKIVLSGSAVKVMEGVIEYD